MMWLIFVMIHQNKGNDKMTSKGKNGAFFSTKPRWDKALSAAERTAGAPLAQCPPPANRGGKSKPRLAHGRERELTRLDLRVKVNIKGYGPARFVAFILYSTMTDSYLKRVDFPDEKVLADGVTNTPADAMRFDSFEDAAMSMPGYEPGLEVMALYDNSKVYFVQTV